jgi:hypothetical protein
MRSAPPARRPWLTALTALTALAALALPPACARDAPLPMVRVQASYDLDCPDREIRIEQEIGGRYKAIGCGRKARYLAACDGLRCEVRGEDDPAIPWRDRPDPDVRKP